MAASGRRSRRTMPLILGGAAAVAAATAGLHNAGAFYAGAPQPAQKGAILGARRLPFASPAIPVARGCELQSAATNRPGPLKWLVAGLAGLGMMRTTRPTANTEAELSKSGLRVVAMRTAGGRRKRLGVPFRSCMLTGRHRFKIIKRTYSEKKNKIWWRPNTRWHNFWWEKEQKWVRLFVSAAAIKECDYVGLENMANKAGLDLYAWCKPHWEPGSKQPLCLKVGSTLQAARDRKYWKNYEAQLNKGKALADIFPKLGEKPLTKTQKRRAWKVWTPPDDSSAEAPERLEVNMKEGE